MPGISPTLRFILAWAFLNVLTNLNYPAPEIHFLAPFRPCPEITILIIGLSVAAWLGLPYRPTVSIPLTAVVIFFRLFRLGDVLVPMYLNRDFNLYIDSQYVPDLIHLLYNTVPLGTFIGYFGAAVTLIVVVGWGTWWAFKSIHRYGAATGQRHLFLALVTALLSLLPLIPPANMGGHPREFSRGFFHRVVGEIDFILHVHGYRTRNLEAILESKARAEQTPASLGKLNGADVYVVFVESYGHTVFANPLHFSMIAPLLKDFEESLKAHSFAVHSNFVTSPTYGGTSWLAHGTFASGVPLTSQLLYDLLVTSDHKMLAHYFNEAGYRTISVMPGTTFPWPEGEVFGYQKKYYAWNFDYRGPKYGWSPMPDQYVLDYIYRKEVANRSQPLFIEYVLITSHAPFHLQPPYLEDWSQIDDGTIFHKKDPITFPIVWPDLSQAGEAYITSIAYELKVIKAYLEQYVDDGALVIILGDHQPNPQITGESRPWSVPIHIISRNPDFLEPFTAWGYTPGMVPRQPLPHPGMETFLYGFLQDFSKPPMERVSSQYTEP
ncbi:MAG: sulfatase-like hydrolase/transferase [Proteobacteria bacterium]|nr:sulfatase-like hydrolase/transferase [Pseudomonadota bacterium]NIS72755.1 sulfatase-like hydrolase/transferase [Pseudomonadota bacterium]